jgi:hypothetical protein
MDTLLFVPPPVIQSPPIRRRLRWPWILAGSLIVVIAAGIVCVWAALHFGWFNEDKRFHRALAALDAKWRTDTNLHEVQGAYGWTLGNVLPSQLNLTTNYTLEGSIIYDVPLDGGQLDQSRVMWLVLTEERQIASIYVSISKDQDRWSVFDALREKYGLRQMRHNSLGGAFYAYFGTTNRQAVFGQQLDALGGMSVEYRDERLCKIADDQKEKRRAAEKKQNTDEIKSRL